MNEKRTFEKNKQKVKNINVRLTDREYEELKKIAVRKGYSFRSIAVRMAIKQYILENTEVTA